MEHLRTHLLQVTDLDPAGADKVIAEVLACLSETVDTFVQRRHAELQREGLRNDQIFTRLHEEVAQRRFAAPPLTDRQLRRLIYG